MGCQWMGIGALAALRAYLAGLSLTAGEIEAALLAGPLLPALAIAGAGGTLAYYASPVFYNVGDPEATSRRNSPPKVTVVGPVAVATAVEVSCRQRNRLLVNQLGKTEIGFGVLARVLGPVFGL
jgi:hypothetical protein